MGLFTRDTAMKFYEQGMKLTRAAVDGIVKTGGEGEYSGPSLPDGTQNPYLINNSHGQFEDITWVLS
jgi:hypothetical protein